MKNHKSVARESIRTLIQKKYYEKYDQEEYNNYLSKYPELRPIDIDTSVDKTLKKNYEEYSDKNINFKELISYKEDERDENLYIKKKTYLTKDKVDKKYFNNENFEETINNDNKNINIEEFSNSNIEEFSNSNIEEFSNINYKINNKINKTYGMKKMYILLLFVITFIIILYYYKYKNNLSK